MSNKLKLCLLIPGIVALGFLRDYLFVNINWIYLHITVQRPNQAVDQFDLLLDWTASEINTLKWILTITFFNLFLFFSLAIIHYLFRNKLFNQITVGFFVSLLAVSGLLYTVGYMTSTLGQLYSTIITCMHMTQSFTPLLILIIVFKFLPKSDSE